MPPRTLRSCLLAAGLASLGATAQAETSPYALGVSLGLQNESNLYRARDNVALAPGLSRSDTVTTASLLANIDQLFGRQRAFGNLSLSDNRYARNDYLNSRGYGLNGGLDWETVERVSGTLGLRANQSQRAFNASTGTVIDPRKNLENTLGVDAAFRVGVVTRWTAESSLGYFRADYSEPAYAGSEYKRQSASLGARWRPSSLINFGTALRYSLTNFPARSDKLTTYYLDFTASWTPGGASSAYARLSPTRQTYQNAAAGNFSGLTGDAGWQWQPTGKLRLNTTLTRNTNQDSYNQRLLVPISPTLAEVVQVTTDNVYATTQLRLALDYEVTGKVAATASASTAQRTLKQINQLLALSDNDRTSALSLGARWTPTRGSQLGCDIGSERRSTGGGLLTRPYSANTIACNGQLLLR